MRTKLRCQCGAVEARVDLQQVYTRVICYCADCQLFARFLGPQHEVLNPQGGTDIIALLPAAVEFTSGRDQLVCLSLSERGILRWYTGCCDTPIGNTPRSSKIAYLGLIALCLPGLETAYGPAKIALHTESASGEVKATPVASFLGVFRIMSGLLAARLGAKSKSNPFFSSDSNQPLAKPRVLSLTEREALSSPASS